MTLPPPTVSPVRRLPAEWEPQSGVLLIWPHAASDWAESLDRVEPVFAAIAATIARFQALLVVCQDIEHREQVLLHLRAAGADLDRVQLSVVETNDTWARDCAAITVLEGENPLLLDFQFNGWGGKFPATADNLLTSRLHAQGRFGNVALETLALILEGGSIESDGQGTILTTSQCLLTPTRNPGWTRSRIEDALQQHLGAERVLWLDHGHLEGDDTDGHIDTLARFCDPSTIAYVACSDPGDPHHAELSAMHAQCSELRQPSGLPYTLVPLPLPDPVFEAGRRLPATYANFLIVNGAVLLPFYDDPMDAVAQERLSSVFSDRVIVGVSCRELLRQGGSLHCLTMQFPKGVLPA